MAHQHQHRFDDAASVSSYSSSSGSSSRSSSRSSSSSGGSKKSRSSTTSHSNIKSDHWAVSFMKWTTGAPPGKQLALRKTKVCDYEEDWGYDDDGAGSVYSDASYISYAWVSPKWDDSISEIASRSSSRTSGRLRREQRGSGGGRHRFTVPPASFQPPPPPPFNHPPPPPPPNMSPGPGFPMYDDEPAFFDMSGGGMDAGYHPAPMPAFGGGGGEPAFVDLNAGGGGGGGGNNFPGKYADWDD
ncbi:hypothetical protein BDP81DRAFT_449203 [Colletotrichum phormii]|uniref:Uncharacterized protein n=1 Tax=Colletotrichum phormii TaxID=359342 RepID=A0AAI9ZS21_9PEZI|nr:uncharacterized protein BDP81DRAFT_449203 [Colletotrichum phormii]KAK1637114.1 hypothetical protein BDP81DRAFT_449203 [Colletotrichum phormii]